MSQTAQDEGGLQNEKVMFLFLNDDNDRAHGALWCTFLVFLFLAFCLLFADVLCMYF